MREIERGEFPPALMESLQQLRDVYGDDQFFAAVDYVHESSVTKTDGVTATTLQLPAVPLIEPVEIPNLESLGINQVSELLRQELDRLITLKGSDENNADLETDINKVENIYDKLMDVWGSSSCDTIGKYANISEKIKAYQESNGAPNIQAELLATEWLTIDRLLHVKPIFVTANMATAGRYLARLQQLRRQEFSDAGFERTEGVVGITRPQPYVFELDDREPFELTDNVALNMTFCRINPGNGGYWFKPNVGEKKFLRMTKAVFYKYQQPATI